MNTTLCQIVLTRDVGVAILNTGKLTSLSLVTSGRLEKSLRSWLLGTRRLINMESIIEEIVEEVCYLSSVGALIQDCYLEDLTASLFNYCES